MRSQSPQNIATCVLPEGFVSKKRNEEEVLLLIFQNLFTHVEDRIRKIVASNVILFATEAKF